MATPSRIPSPQISNRKRPWRRLRETSSTNSASSRSEAVVVYDVEERVAAPTGASGHGALHVPVRPSAEFLRVIQDLTDDGSARFGVPPELGFQHHQPALGRGIERIDGPRRGVQLHANGHGAGIGAVDFLDGQRLGVAEEQLLQPRLVVVRGRPVAGQGDLFQWFAKGRREGSGFGAVNCEAMFLPEIRPNADAKL